MGAGVLRAGVFGARGAEGADGEGGGAPLLAIRGSHCTDAERKELLKSVEGRIRGEAVAVSTTSLCGRFYHFATTQEGGQTLHSIVTIAAEEKVEDEVSSVKRAFCAMMRGVDTMRFFDMEREETIAQIMELDKDRLTLLLLMLQYAGGKRIGDLGGNPEFGQIRHDLDESSCESRHTGEDCVHAPDDHCQCEPVGEGERGVVVLFV